MSDPIILWNPINFIEGEGSWFFYSLGLLLGAAAMTKATSILIRWVSSRINTPYFMVVVRALYQPIIYFLWAVVVLRSLDLATDGFLSEGHEVAWAFVYNAIALGIFGWSLFRLKNDMIAYILASKHQKKTSPEAFSTLALSKLLTIVILVILLVLINDITGMNFTTLLAFGGVGGLALAFASQEIISNFFGGLMVHITRPFVVGETILFPSSSIEGKVEEIGWYQTRLRSSSKSAVYIPNSLFTKALLINKSRIVLRPIELPLFVEVKNFDALGNILVALRASLQQYAQLDQTAQMGANIRSIGNPACIVVSALTTTIDDMDYYTLYNDIALTTAHVIAEHEGRLVVDPAYTGMLGSRTPSCG